MNHASLFLLLLLSVCISFSFSYPAPPSSRDFKYVYPHVLCPSRNNAIRISHPQGAGHPPLCLVVLLLCESWPGPSGCAPRWPVSADRFDLCLYKNLNSSECPRACNNDDSLKGRPYDKLRKRNRFPLSGVKAFFIACRRDTVRRIFAPPFHAHTGTHPLTSKRNLKRLP